MTAHLRLVVSADDTHSAEDGRARGEPPDIDVELFFRTIRLRELLDEHGSLTFGELARQLVDDGGDRAELADDIERLIACGLVECANTTVAQRERRTGLFKFSERRALCLTEDGMASLHLAGPPRPEGVDEVRWAAELARSIAEHYGVEVRALLRGCEATVARARFAYALHARGWALHRIEEHFAMPPTWALRGVERWKRLRLRCSMRTGEDLLRWRTARSMTQSEAGTALGVSERTVRAAEQHADRELPRKIRRGLQRLL